MTPGDHIEVDDVLVARLLTERYARDDVAGCPEIETLALRLMGDTDAALEAHLGQCEECSRLLALHQELTTRGLLPSLEGGAEVIPLHGRGRLRMLAVAAAILLVVGGAVWIWQATIGSVDPTRELAVKGEADSIAIAVKRGDQSFSARPGDVLLDGDQLGFFYSAARPGYLVLFDLDEHGDALLLFPAGGTGSAPIEAGTKLPLPDGGVMQAGEGCEWVVGVFSDQPMDNAEIQRFFRQSMLQPRTGCEIELVVPGARTLWVFPVR